MPDYTIEVLNPKSKREQYYWNVRSEYTGE